VSSPTLTVAIFQITKNCHKHYLSQSYCLSWYISDAAFIIANYLAKNELKGKGRHMGKHGIYHEMIQTWVTYEVVKVLHLY
jgi:hypothetical protein